jgi:hypothetical protein
MADAHSIRRARPARALYPRGPGSDPGEAAGAGRTHGVPPADAHASALARCDQAREGPVLSFYLQLSPERRSRAVWHSAFSSLAHETTKAIRDRRKRRMVEEEFDRRPLTAAAHRQHCVGHRGLALRRATMLSSQTRRWSRRWFERIAGGGGLRAAARSRSPTLRSRRASRTPTSLVAYLLRAGHRRSDPRRTAAEGVRLADVLGNGPLAWNAQGGDLGLQQLTRSCSERPGLGAAQFVLKPKQTAGQRESQPACPVYARKQPRWRVTWDGRV